MKRKRREWNLVNKLSTPKEGTKMLRCWHCSSLVACYQPFIFVFRIILHITRHINHLERLPHHEFCMNGKAGIFFGTVPFSEYLRFRMEEQEMKKIAEERRREKMEDRLARERVKKQIEADKIVRCP